jgi:hypothetical protein
MNHWQNEYMEMKKSYLSLKKQMTGGSEDSDEHYNHCKSFGLNDDFCTKFSKLHFVVNIGGKSHMLNESARRVILVLFRQFNVLSECGDILHNIELIQPFKFDFEGLYDKYETSEICLCFHNSLHCTDKIMTNSMGNIEREECHVTRGILNLCIRFYKLISIPGKNEKEFVIFYKKIHVVHTPVVDNLDQYIGSKYNTEEINQVEKAIRSASAETLAEQLSTGKIKYRKTSR